MLQVSEFKGPIVDLPETAEAGLILCWKTGVAYTSGAYGLSGFLRGFAPLPERAVLVWPNSD